MRKANLHLTHKPPHLARTDVVKMVTLGAKASGVVVVQLFGLAADGIEGLDHALRILKDETSGQPLRRSCLVQRKPMPIAFWTNFFKIALFLIIALFKSRLLPSVSAILDVGVAVQKS